MVQRKREDKIEIFVVWRGPSGQKYTLCGQSMKLDASLADEGIFICNISLVYKLPRFASKGTTICDFQELRGKYKRKGFRFEIIPSGWADHKCRTYELMVSWETVRESGLED